MQIIGMIPVNKVDREELVSIHNFAVTGIRFRNLHTSKMVINNVNQNNNRE
jgi:hypothetical protein